VYSRNINNQTFRFGVSGLLYKSNILMYDHQSESLWSQVLQRAVTGPLTDTKLQRLPSTLTTWKKWQKKHPDTDVLTPDTGYVRDYSKDPYESYYKSRSGLFGFLKGGPGAEDKELVAGVEINGSTKAYPLQQIRKYGQIQDELAGRIITLSYDLAADTLTVTDEAGHKIDPLLLYWFVWKNIYPDSAVFQDNTD
jgi:hypothetical protein